MLFLLTWCFIFFFSPYVAITISHRTGLEEEPIKKLSKKLLGTMEIRNLKNLLQKLFGISSSRQKLYVISNSQVNINKIDRDIR